MGSGEVGGVPVGGVPVGVVVGGVPVGGVPVGGVPVGGVPVGGVVVGGVPVGGAEGDPMTIVGVVVITTPVLTEVPSVIAEYPDKRVEDAAAVETAELGATVKVREESRARPVMPMEATGTPVRLAMLALRASISETKPDMPSWKKMVVALSQGVSTVAV